jgi:putative DNA primase/helicase
VREVGVMGIKLMDCVDVTPKKVSPISHDDIMLKLLSKVVKVNYQELAYPGHDDLMLQKERIEKNMTNPDGSVANLPSKVKEVYNEIIKKLNGMVVTKQHYVIYTIDEILRLAIHNDWGICRNNGFIYFYNAAFWRFSEEDELKTFLSAVALKMGIKYSESKYYKFVDELFKQFNFSASMPKAPITKGTTLVNLQNGTFEISPKQQLIRLPNRKDFLKYQLPFEYDPLADAPIFKKFLNRVLPDLECQTVFAEYIGYVFIQSSELKLEKTLFCYGTGANGKSVMFEIIKALLGPDNVCNYSLQSLTDQTGYYRAHLANHLVNYASEINGNLESSIFKQLVSGEPVEARHIYGKPFTITNYAKMIFNGNTLPKDVEHTNAYFRRFLIIPFSVTIPAEEQDKDLDKKIVNSELPGVFNWVLAGLERVLKQRNFSKCDAAERMVSEYKTQSDTVALFLEDHNYEGSTTIKMLLANLHQEYISYCQTNKYIPCSNRILAERLRNLNYNVDREKKGTVVYLTNNAVWV